MEQIVRNIIKDLGIQDWNPMIQIVVTDLIFQHLTTKYLEVHSLNSYLINTGMISYENPINHEEVVNVLQDNLNGVYLAQDSSSYYDQEETKLQEFVVGYNDKWYAAQYQVNSYGVGVEDFIPFHEVQVKEKTIQVYE